MASSMQSSLTAKVTKGIIDVIQKIQRTLLTPRAVKLVAEPLFRMAGMKPEGSCMDLQLQKHILIVRLDEIGDAVLTIPFMRELRRNCGQAWITLITRSNVRELMELCPYVDEVITFDLSSRAGMGLARILAGMISFARQNLWKHRYDLAVVPRFDADEYYAGYLAYLSGAAVRVGYSEKNSTYGTYKNRGSDALYTFAFREDSLKHEVLHNLDLLKHLGGTVRDDALELWLSPREEEHASGLLSSFKNNDQAPIIAFSPFSRTANRRWPAEKFLELGTWLHRMYRANVVIIGGPDAYETGCFLEKNMEGNVVNYAGQMTLRMTAAVLKHCRLFVGNDSGPMHIAAAVKTPVVEICCHPKNGNPAYPYSPLRFGPWGVRSEVLQPEAGIPPCSYTCSASVSHCISQISVPQVQEAVRRILD